jgi:type IV pilus assembly protein PilA
MRIIRTNNKGFSLIELMIVVAIIGLLAMIALPNFVSYRNRALIASAVGSCEAIRTAMAVYAVDSPGNLFPVDKWVDGPAGWGGFRSFLGPLGTNLKENMRVQGFRDFTYRTIAVDGEDGADYVFLFQCASASPEQRGSLIEVRSSGISRWTGSL